MTLGEIIFDCYSTVSGSTLISDDISLSLDLIRFKVVNVRAQLIRQEAQKGYAALDNIFQSIPCMPFIQIDESLCPCALPSGCIILRTQNRVPRFIELSHKNMLTKVSGPGLKGSGYALTPYARVPYAGLNKETANTTKAFLYDSYIYLINPPNLIEQGTIRGVFEDPRDAANYANCSGTPCWDDNSEFPISAHMLPTLKELVVKDLTMLMGTPKDDKGDERFNKPGDSK